MINNTFEDSANIDYGLGIQLFNGKNMVIDGLIFKNVSIPIKNYKTAFIYADIQTSASFIIKNV